MFVIAPASSIQSGSPLPGEFRRGPATLKKHWKRTNRAIARCLFTSEHEFSFSERTIFAFYVDKIHQGLDDAQVARLIDDCWVWRNVFVAETDTEAERVGVPLFQQMQQQRALMRERVFKEQGVRLQSHAPGPTAPAARTVIEHALIYGSPATVAEKLAAVDAIGVGGVIMSFRLGPMSYDVAASSLKLFAEKVMPALRG